MSVFQTSIARSLAPLGMTRFVTARPSIDTNTAQITDRLGVILRVEDGCSGDEDVGAVLDRQARSLGIDAAIDCDLERRLMRLLPFACAFYLGHHLRSERLTTETGMHSHDEQDVDLVEE